MSLGKRIALLRNKKNITQEHLANALGIARATIAMYETDKREPDNTNLKKIADFFGVSIDYLLGRKNIKNQQTFSNNLTGKDEKEIEKMLTQMRESLTKQDGLMLSGEPASEEALESILDALEYGMRQAKRINKKYTPKKYRKDDTNE